MAFKRLPVAAPCDPPALPPLPRPQSFAGLITAANLSDGAITSVGIKVELSTERGRAALLYDSTSQPLPKLEAGQRHDFTVKHDVKELVSCCWGFLHHQSSW